MVKRVRLKVDLTPAQARSLLNLAVSAGLCPDTRPKSEFRALMKVYDALRANGVTSDGKDIKSEDVARAWEKDSIGDS